jgi:hypothetical protein
MARLLKVLAVVGVSSVYLMQAPCTFAPHGFSIIPNGLIPNPLTTAWTTLLGGLGT